ncbi:MAG TPA: hypothetical protein VNA14_05255 [Mycobacteriales bacterium]|nr:hypothetical protein [Mycobacteriales bacterium]
MPTSPRLRDLAALVVLCVLGAPAEAAPRRPCELLKDAKGDAGLNGGEGGIGGPVPGTDDGSLDIISADLAADATRLTVVIRVAGLRSGASPLQGESWSFHFASPESAFFLSADRTHAGTSFTLFRYTTDYSGDTSQSFLFERIGEVTGLLDTDASEIRMTAPLSMFKPHDTITTGTTLHKLLVISWLKNEPIEGWSNASEGDETGGGGKASYRVGTKNCVRVGS